MSMGSGWILSEEPSSSRPGPKQLWTRQKNWPRTIIGRLVLSVRSCVSCMTGYQHCGRGVLNLCMPYSSRDEIATAVEETIRDALLEGKTGWVIQERELFFVQATERWNHLQANHRRGYRGPSGNRKGQWPSFGYSNQDKWCQASEWLLTLAGWFSVSGTTFSRGKCLTHSIR